MADRRGTASEAGEPGEKPSASPKGKALGEREAADQARAVAAGLSRPFSIMTSAIWMEFRAAPLRI